MHPIWESPAFEGPGRLEERRESGVDVNLAVTAKTYEQKLLANVQSNAGSSDKVPYEGNVVGGTKEPTRAYSDRFKRANRPSD